MPVLADYEGTAARRRDVICGASCMEGLRVTFRVTSCTEYVDATAPTVHELYERAWILRPATKRRPAGFVRASELPYGDRVRMEARDSGD
jgi:hypothetical protein